MSTPAPTASERRADDAARGRRPRAGGTGAPPTGRDGLQRLQVLLAGAMGAILAGYTLMVPLAAVLAATGGQDVSADGTLASAVPMWLAAQQIPLLLDGQPLGVLPLLPTLAVFAVVSAAARWSVRRLGGRLRHDAGAVVASQAGAAAAVAVLGGALLPRDMAVTAPWASMVGAGLVAGTAAGTGVLRACGMPAAWRERLAGWPGAALAGARAGAAGLLLSGSLALLAGLAVRAGAVAASFAALAPGAGAGLGVALLAVAYLPNALLAGTAWALGPGISVGVAHSGPFGAVPGPLPPFPLFAAMPAQSPAWAVLVLLLPLGAGVATGVACSQALGPAAGCADRLAASGLAAGLTAAGAGLAASLAGGRLASGPYDPVSLSGWLVFLTALLLVGAPAVAVCAGLHRAGPGRARGVAAARRAARAAAGGADARRTTADRSGAAVSRRGGAEAREAGRPARRTRDVEGSSGRAGAGAARATHRAGASGAAGRTDGPPDRGAAERRRPAKGGAARGGAADAGRRTRAGCDRRTGGPGGRDGHHDPVPDIPQPAPDEAGDAPPRTVADLVARRERGTDGGRAASAEE